MARISDAFAPNEIARPEFGHQPEAEPHRVGCKCWYCTDTHDGSEDYSTYRRHRLITLAQNAALQLVPAIVVGSAMYSIAAPRAFEAAAAMVVTQQLVARIPAWKGSDAVEWGAIIAGGAASIAVLTSAASANSAAVLLAAGLTALMTFWPYAFHAWRGGTVTDFELASRGRPRTP